MKCKHLLFLAILGISSLVATAQSGSIVGTWALTAADRILPDGTRTSDFGDHPHGLVIFTADGHYAVQIYRADRPKLPADDRLKGTPDDYKTIFLGISTHFGQYAIDPDKHTITFNIDHASFPNWDDTTQVRSYELEGDELSWKVPARPDGAIPVTVLRRLK